MEKRTKIRRARTEMRCISCIAGIIPITLTDGVHYWLVLIGQMGLLLSLKVPGTSSTEMRYVRAAKRRQITP